MLRIYYNINVINIIKIVSRVNERQSKKASEQERNKKANERTNVRRYMLVRRVESTRPKAREGLPRWPPRHFPSILADYLLKPVADWPIPFLTSFWHVMKVISSG